MDSKEIEKATPHVVVDIIEYLPDAVVSRTIIRKTTGSVTATSFASGEEWPEKTVPFDTYVQVIDGEAEVIIDEISHIIKLGEGIVIPAHSPHCFNATRRFKMVSTVIKSGYEE